ncbi:MAG: phenylalanine--tRNA ligase subunit beta, partial [Mycoplasma sp.]|nr:phenylalanine--tRNA ligase subunit beta [Mycoplasma sp.]
MLLSKKLLGDFFSEFKKISDKDLIKAITAIGAEVESVYNFEQVNNLIVGEITHVEKHPKSEKLNLCTVLVNNKKRLIVCGASNVKPDARVIVALEDAEMVDGRVIKYKELLGIESQGMICAYNELTKRTEFLNSIDADNVIILDSNAKVNDTNPLKYINLDDTIFDISLPSNRNELNGIIGLVCDLMPHLNFKKPFDFS